MKVFVKGMDDVFAAVIFSEVGEHSIAREFLVAPSASPRMKTSVETHLRTYTPLVPEGDP